MHRIVDLICVRMEQMKDMAMAAPMRRPFDPVVHDLDPNFRLTRFSDLKGLGCKVSHDAMTKMLEPFKEQEKSQLEQEQVHFQYVAPSPRIGKLVYGGHIVGG